MCNTDNIMRIDFEIGCANSDGEFVEGTKESVCVLYNKSVITYDEVCELIYSGEYEYDNRIVVTTTTRANNLRGKKEN